MVKLDLTGFSDDEALEFLISLISFTLEDPLSSMEVKVLTGFLMLPYERYRHQRFSSHARKKVYRWLINRYSWDFKYPNINAKINSLYKKGLLYRDDENQLHLVKNLEDLFFRYISGDKEEFEVYLKLPGFKNRWEEYVGDTIKLEKVGSNVQADRKDKEGGV